MMRPEIGVSIICMDQARIADEVTMLDDVVDRYHVDVMDGIRVPRYGMYPEQVVAIAGMTTRPMDVHLMVERVEFAVDAFSEIPSVDYVSFHHAGNEGRTWRIADRIRERGKSPVLALDLDTPSDVIGAHEDVVSGFLFMGIHPGVLKQIHRPDLVTLKTAPWDFRGRRSSFFVQVDGGVNWESATDLAKNGINSFVCGSSTVFKNAPSGARRRRAILDNVNKMRKLIDV
jgi:ribulose-phosphate 3-epimerase